MEKLLKLINEYEENRWTVIDDGLTEEEREDGAIIEEKPLRSEFQGHLWHCNANTVAFEKDTFDYRALSKKYGFIKRLCDKELLESKEVYQIAILEQIKKGEEYRAYIQRIVLADNPIQYLISILK